MFERDVLTPDRIPPAPPPPSPFQSAEKPDLVRMFERDVLMPARISPPPPPPPPSAKLDRCRMFDLDVLTPARIPPAPPPPPPLDQGLFPANPKSQWLPSFVSTCGSPWTWVMPRPNFGSI